MDSSEKVLVTKSSMPPYEEYIEAIKPLWDSHWLTNMGIYHKELEERLKEYLGVSELSLMVNGHMALELAIQAMNFPVGSEVITTPFTFISTTHAIVRNGLEPVFCDVKDTDGTIDENKIEQLITEKTVAIVPVHVYGNICNVEKIAQIAHKHNLKIIYDAAHAFGENYKGKGIGNFGDATIFSFHATKVFNSIEGGAVAFKEKDLYEKLYNLKNFGIRGEELVVEVGANAKMNEFAAIMGLCNLKYIRQDIEKRKQIFDLYVKLLKDVEGLRFFKRDGNVEYNYAYLPVLFENRDELDVRNTVYEELKKRNIFARKYFYPIATEQNCYRDKYLRYELENARALASQVLVLPLYVDLDVEQVKRIADIIRMVCRH